MISINLFFLLRRGIYPYEYMDDWDEFNEILLPDKKVFYRELPLLNVINQDYIHAQKVFKRIQNKKPRRISWFVS